MAIIPDVLDRWLKTGKRSDRGWGVNFKGDLNFAIVTIYGEVTNSKATISAQLPLRLVLGLGICPEWEKIFEE